MCPESKITNYLGMGRTKLNTELGAVSRKPRKLFGPVKPFLDHHVSKNGEVYTPETSCMKGTSLHIKKM